MVNRISWVLLSESTECADFAYFPCCFIETFNAKKNLSQTNEWMGQQRPYKEINFFFKYTKNDELCAKPSQSDYFSKA